MARDTCIYEIQKCLCLCAMLVKDNGLHKAKDENLKRI